MSHPPDQLERYCRDLIPGYDAWRSVGDCYFDADRANWAINFIENCCKYSNARWAGQPFMLQPWQVAFVGNLFGWINPDGNRRYRKALLFTPKKQGKSELLSAIALYLLFADGEPSPEIVSAAANAEQARKVFEAATKMISLEPELSSRAEVLKTSIRYPAQAGSYKVINSAAKTKHGGNLSAAIIDELFAIEDPALVDALETSTAARSQPLILYLTTAGDNPETVGGEIYEYACKVRDAIFDDQSFLPVIYEAPKDADIGSPVTWRKAAPNLGVTVSEDVYAKEYQEAKTTPRKMNVFRQFRLNQWVESASSWISLADWSSCSGVVVAPPKSKCYCGLDLSSTTDTTAFVMVFPIDGKYLVKPFIFLPKDCAAGRAKRQKNDKAPYSTWANSGHIILTEGNTVDYGEVEKVILEQAELFDIQELQADKYNASGLLERLQKEGMRVTTVRQGWSLAEATKETERLILTKKLIHPNNPALSWQISNCLVHEDKAGNYWPVKNRSRSRIDAAVSLIMAVNSACFGEFRPNNQVEPAAVGIEYIDLGI